MAENIFRRIKVLFDRRSAEQAEAQLQKSMAEGGKKAGESFVRELKAAFDKRMADLKVQLAKGLISPQQFKKQAELAAKEFNAGILKGMQAAQRAGKVTDAEFVKLGRTLKTVGDTGASVADKLKIAFVKAAASVAAFFGTRAIIGFFASSIREGLEAEQSVARLTAVLEPLGIAYRNVAAEVDKFTDHIQESTRFSDDDAREALTALVTITGDYNKSLDLLSLVADVAAKRQTTMADAAEVVGKAAIGATVKLGDLGVTTEKGNDAITKIRQNIGGLAEKQGKTLQDRLETLNNLWKEFKEQVGLAIIGTDGVGDSVEKLKRAIVDLTQWVKNHQTEIHDFTNAVLRIGGAFAWVTIQVGKFFDKIIAVDRFFARVEQKLFRPGELKEGVGIGALEDQPEPTPKATRKATEEKGVTKAVSEEKKKQTDLEREQARERERVSEELAIAQIRLEQKVTDAFAAEIVRRQQIQGTFKPPEFGTLEEGWQRLADAQAMLAIGLGEDLTPKLSTVTTTIETATKATDNLADAMARAAGRSQGIADQFSTPWKSAFGILEDEVKNQEGLLVELSNMFAHEGLKGLARYALFKAKENLARVIEEIALALGALGLGMFGSAGEHFASAAKHGAAALAWKALAGSGGGGGGTGGASAAGGVGGGVGLERAQTTQRQEQEINIYLTGPGFNALNPQVQKVVYGASQLARERYGSNTKIRIHQTGNQ